MQQLLPESRRRRWQALLGALATAAALAVPATALASGIQVTLHAPGHKMPIHKAWRYTVDVRHDGARVGGKIRYQFYIPAMSFTAYTQKWQRFSHGVYHGTMKPWTNSQTSEAEGIPMTLKIEVDTKYGDKTVDYKIVITK